MSVYGQAQEIDARCLACHQSEQIPSQLMYKRYLMKYSSKERIAEAMLKYLKNPQQSNSIMPKPFFLKFPMKEDLKLTDEALKQGIGMFIEKFDMQKRLRVKP